MYNDIHTMIQWIAVYRILVRFFECGIAEFLGKFAFCLCHTRPLDLVFLTNLRFSAFICVPVLLRVSVSPWPSLVAGSSRAAPLWPNTFAEKSLRSSASQPILSKISQTSGMLLLDGHLARSPS